MAACQAIRVVLSAVDPKRTSLLRSDNTIEARFSLQIQIELTDIRHNFLILD